MGIPKEKELKQETIRFFRLLSKYSRNNIDLFYIKNPEKRDTLRLQIATAIPYREAYTVLAKENAWWKNHRYKENVYLAPSQNQKLNIVFIDDPEDQEYYEYAFLVVQTSSQKVQAYYLLDKYLEKDKITRIQKHLQQKYKADIGSVDALHLRRIPGFTNTKYPDMPIVKIFYEATTPIFLSTSELLEDLEDNTPPRKRKQNIKSKPKSEPENDIYELWRRLYYRDKNIADIHFTYHLIKKGYSYEDIYSALFLIRGKEAKKHDLNDYIKRTYLKAKIYNLLTNDIRYNNKEFLELYRAEEQNLKGVRVIDKLESWLDKLVVRK